MMKIATSKIELVKVVKKLRKVIIDIEKVVRAESGLKKLTNNYLYDRVKGKIYGLS